MTHNLTPADLALWAALPMAHTSNVEKRLAMILDTSRRRAFPRRFPALALTGGVAALVSMAVLHPIARGQAASPASAALSRQHRASAEPKDANGHVRQVLLLKYYGEGWVETHPEAVSRAEWVRPLQAAALYGSWAEAYGGVRSGNTERFLLRAKALEPDNPQWPDRLGTFTAWKRSIPPRMRPAYRRKKRWHSINWRPIFSARGRACPRAWRSRPSPSANTVKPGVTQAICCAATRRTPL